MFLAVPGEVDPELLRQAVAAATKALAEQQAVATANTYDFWTMLIQASTTVAVGYFTYRTVTFNKEQKVTTEAILHEQVKTAATSEALLKQSKGMESSITIVAQQTDGIVDKLKNELLQVRGEAEHAKGVLQEKTKHEAAASSIAERAAERVADVAIKVAEKVEQAAEVAAQKVKEHVALDTDKLKEEIKSEVKTERVAGVFDRDATDKMKKEIKREVKDEIEIKSEVVKEGNK